MDLHARRYWIFDLDGTLTHAVHDFDGFRRRVGLPPGEPLLEAIARRPPTEAGQLRAAVEAWEWSYVESARPADGARALLDHLCGIGCRLGILTRNTATIARRTLEVTGLADCVDADCVLGRDDAEPKPSAAGVERLLSHWHAMPDDAVMLGDFLFDLQAGRGAGVATVLVQRDLELATRWSAWADRVVPTLAGLVPVRCLR